MLYKYVHESMKKYLYFICHFSILFSTSADTFSQRNLQWILTWVIEQQVGVRASCSSPYHLVFALKRSSDSALWTVWTLSPQVSQHALCPQNDRLGVPDETGTSWECWVPSGLCAARQVEIPAETTSSSCVWIGLLCQPMRGPTFWVLSGRTKGPKMIYGNTLTHKRRADL